MNRTNFAFWAFETLFTSLKAFNNKCREGMNDHRKLTSLKKIMKAQSLDTFFQPILDLKTEQNVGYEVLNRPPLSHIFPSTEDFYNFIGQTDQVFHFECFCRNLSLQRFFDVARMTPGEKEALIFINIHPQVLMDTHYKSGETLQLLDELGISPSQIVFELTEKQAVTDFIEFEKVLNNYRSQGFRIAIDDAGSGYNSLKTLVYLKPEFIKLDKFLIRHIHMDIAQQRLVKLILDFSNQSGTYVIAEGIESVEELNYLQEIGIHYGQGYALGRPAPKLNPGQFPYNLIVNY